MINTFLFDLDGTLIDEKIYDSIYKPVIDKIKKKQRLNDEQLAKKAVVFGIKKNKSGRYDTGDLCREFGMLDDYYKVLESKIKPKAQTKKQLIKIFSEIKKKKKTIGIVSNSMARTVNLHLKKHGIIKYVDFVFSAEMPGHKKDTDEFWATLISENYITPKDSLMIGNNFIDDVMHPQRFNFKTYLLHTQKDLDRILHYLDEAYQ